MHQSSPLTLPFQLLVHVSTHCSVYMNVNVGSGGNSNSFVKRLLINMHDSTNSFAFFCTWVHPSRYTGELLLY